MREASVHQHRRNYRAEGETYGQRLDPGDIIQEGDLQGSSRNMHWTKCPFKLHGKRLKFGGPVTIRPLPVLILGQKPDPISS